MQKVHKGYYTRGYLPHYDAAAIVQSVTFRLYGSLPDWINTTRKDSKSRRRIDDILDRGELGRLEESHRKIVEDALLHFQAQRYFLLAWVIMPNHVHVCFEQKNGYPLGKVLQSWKRFSASKINEAFRKHGSIWQRDFFDKAVRSERQLIRVINYIHGNPVKARLVSKPADWRWSSAWENRNVDLMTQWRKNT